MRNRALYLLLAAVLAAGVLIAALDASAQHNAPQDAQVNATPEGRRADVGAFRTQFLAPDRAYSNEARAEAETRLATLDANTEIVSQAYFELELARIVALADNGHTASFAPWRAPRFNRIALRFAPFGEEFYVLRADAANADLLGARLVAIDGRPIAEVRPIARTLTGGVAAWRDRWAAFFLESPEQMHALNAAREPGAAMYRFRLRSGAMVERTLAGAAPDGRAPIFHTAGVLYPSADGALAAASAPWSLQNPGSPFRWREAPELDGVVIELRQNNDAPDMPIRDWLAAMGARLDDMKPRNIVLDMRMNGGGDLNTTRDFVQSLPQRASGRIFVLTSPWTFSAAISSVGYLEQAAPDRVTIVGEGVGDRLKFFSEGDVITLPNSQVMLLNATERHDYITGCRGATDCHGPVVRNPISVPTLAPDLDAPWTIDAYLAGRDPGMEAIAAALR